MTNTNYQIPPFRDPHHSASAVSLIGGGTNPKPGKTTYFQSYVTHQQAVC
ncbi:ATP-binding protein [Lentibacillus sp. CBA3610]|nr:ATP-binding protein [Lentibacillus sp. CBA3610]QKY70260.1 hypothetical protein Len3610_12215 [Lentibacillus sp. CBA3610]